MRISNEAGRIVRAVEPKPEAPKPPPAAPAARDNHDLKINDIRQRGANSRAALNAKFDQQTVAAKTTPTDALDRINKLPVPNPQDRTAVREYNRQRAAIADDAISNSAPPKREDFRGLNPRTAEVEYTEARHFYDSQIRDLQRISDEAIAQPDVLPRSANLPNNYVRPEDVEAEANRLIESAGGKNNLDATRVGEELARVAQSDPGKANAMTQVILGQTADNSDRGIVNDADKTKIVEAMTNRLSDDDLARIARTGSGKELLQRAQTQLLSGGIRRTSDGEQAAADRIQRSLLDNGVTFSDAYNGVGAFSLDLGARFDPNAAPEDVAASLKAAARENDTIANLDAFTSQLQAHKGDAEWLQRFYSALGRESAGELINQTVNPSSYQPAGTSGYQESARERADAVRSSLETLHSSGRLSQQDLAALVKNTGDNPHVALEIFGKSSNTALRSDYIKAVAASGGDPTKAAVVGMIARLPANQRGAALSGLDQSQTDSLFVGAMRAKTEIRSLSDEIAGNYEGQKISIGDVTSLIDSAANNAFSIDLKQKLFLAASNALNDDRVIRNYNDNNALREDLGKIFVDETNRTGTNNLLTRMASDQNGSLTQNEKKALSGFFAYTVYSPNQTANSYQLSAHVKQLFLTAGNVLTGNGATPAGFRDKNSYAILVGSLFKAAEDGLRTSQTRYQNDESARKEAIKFFVDTAAALVPGVPGALTKGLGDGILKTLINETTGEVDSAVRGRLTGGTIDFINSLYSQSNKGFLGDSDLSVILEGFNENLPADLYTNLQIGYR